MTKFKNSKMLVVLMITMLTMVACKKDKDGGIAPVTDNDPLHKRLSANGDPYSDSVKYKSVELKDILDYDSSEEVHVILKNVQFTKTDGFVDTNVTEAKDCHGNTISVDFYQDLDGKTLPSKRGNLAGFYNIYRGELSFRVHIEEEFKSFTAPRCD